MVTYGLDKRPLTLLILVRLFLVYMTIIMILFVIIQPSYEMYVDCQARCMLTSKRERNQDTLQMCRDECELLDLLEQEDRREGKHYKYRQY